MPTYQGDGGTLLHYDVLGTTASAPPLIVLAGGAARHPEYLGDLGGLSAKTIAPYSMRGREQPWVAAPRTWAELAEPGLRHLHYREVLERLADGLDPMAGLTLPLQQPPLRAPPSERADRLNRVRERLATLAGPRRSPLNPSLMNLMP